MYLCVVQEVIDAIQSFLFKFLLMIDAIVYSFINWAYQIILILAKGDFLSGSNGRIEELVNRVYVIIGVVVLFLVAYSLLKHMVNPDEALKGKDTPVKLISNVIVSIVLIALVPTIFKFAMDFQSALLNQNTLGKLILGDNTGAGDYDNSSDMISNGGMTMATSVFQAFFGPNSDKGYCTGDPAVDNAIKCEKSVSEIDINGTPYDTWWSNVKNSNNLMMLTQASGKVADDKITYRFIISTVAGVFVLFVLLRYCVDIAVRLVKLAVYQIIAPLPILCRIIPQEQSKKIFSNWLKAVISTYLEVFIRLAILYFCILMMNVAIDSLKELFVKIVVDWNNANPIILLLAKAFVIIGIIFFAKDFPKIIKDITGLDGDKYNPFKAAMQAASVIGGGVTTAARSWNAKDAEGNKKKTFNRFRSALAGAGSGAFRAGWNSDKIKSPADVKKTAHDASEAAIKKRIQRENDKYNREVDKKKYLDEINAQRDKQGQEAKNKVSGIRYVAHRKVQDVKEWAGAGDYNALAITRIKEFASKVDSGFSSLEGTWKKSQAYVDAKTEAEKYAKQLDFVKSQYGYDDIYKRIMNENGFDKDNKDDVAKAQKMAIEAIKSSTGYDMTTDFENAARTKFIQEGIVKTEQEKKAASIVAAARNIQLSLSQYSDLKFDVESAITAQAKPGEKQALIDAYKHYGDLSVENNYKRLLEDLKSPDAAKKKRAQQFIDALDKVNLQAQDDKRQAEYDEERRKSTLSGGNPKDGGSK